MYIYIYIYTHTHSPSSFWKPHIGFYCATGGLKHCVRGLLTAKVPKINNVNT